jgi:hypothetical protein
MEMAAERQRRQRFFAKLPTPSHPPPPSFPNRRSHSGFPPTHSRSVILRACGLDRWALCSGAMRKHSEAPAERHGYSSTRREVPSLPHAGWRHNLDQPHRPPKPATPPSSALASTWISLDPLGLTWICLDLNHRRAPESPLINPVALARGGASLHLPPTVLTVFRAAPGRGHNAPAKPGLT